MPVKDAFPIAEEAIRAVRASGHMLTVYDDFSMEENAAELNRLGRELEIQIVHLNAYTHHSSPNYRWVLIDAQRRCIEEKRDLVIIESDVIVRPDTISRLLRAATPQIGIVAAVTTNQLGTINFPYEYAHKYTQDAPCRKRLSFCCTLLTNAFLQSYDFAQLDESKNWYDVSISRMARRLGFENILQISNPVVHKPHSSRPWKNLKDTHPLRYYWNKLIHGRDKI